MKTGYLQFTTLFHLAIYLSVLFDLNLSFCVHSSKFGKCLLTTNLSKLKTNVLGTKPKHFKQKFFYYFLVYIFNLKLYNHMIEILIAMNNPEAIQLKYVIKVS